MKIDFDQNKSNKNLDERGLAFDVVVEFEWESAVIQEDLRKAYSERRFVAAGNINCRLHIICFTLDSAVFLMCYASYDACRHCEPQAKQSSDLNLCKLIYNKATGLPRCARNDDPSITLLKTAESSLHQF